MRRQLLPGLLMTIAMTVLVGLAFPLAVTAVAQVAFHHQANGSLFAVDGKAVGSSLLGQNFTDPKYFSPRPSAAGADGYDGLSSAASNLGPSNQTLLDTVEQRVADYRKANGLSATDPVPVDAVTASGSGLDPHISVANARIQAARVAKARGMDVEAVLALVDRHTEGRQWGFLGEKVVNVLELNLDLDRQT
jgi:potassium-transporting ATPase KdpC subunit